MRRHRRLMGAGTNMTMFMATTSASNTVVLKGGLCTPLAVLRVLWDLEDRGAQVRLAADGGLLVGPPGLLSAGDRALIRRHRDELVRLVTYVDEVIA